MLMTNIPEVSSRLFTYCVNTKNFVAEASDLRDFRVVRLYDDAIDVGFYLVSENTGKKVLFTQEADEYHDGELIAYHFSSLSNQNPENLRDLNITVFND